MLTREKFDLVYKPFYPYAETLNEFGELKTEESPYWETHGYELDVVMAYADRFPNRVFTLVDTDTTESGLMMLPGYHLVNRVGYILTKVAYNDKDQFIEY